MPIGFDFSQRASLAVYPELMDQPCGFEELRACLQDIARVNRLTFAYRPTLQWLDAVVARLPKQGAPLHIVDVGSGYGDLLRRIAQWADRRGIMVRLTGIDLNPDAVLAARAATLPGAVTYVGGNAFDFDPSDSIDLIVSSLMTHHFENAEVVAFLRWMEARARLGWFINDLHRQPMPYHLFKLLTRMTRWHPFVKHDGQVSILRSFRREDWQRLCQQAGLHEDDYTVQEFRPARLCVRSAVRRSPA